MASILYKWMLGLAFWLTASSLDRHPVYISVTEIAHNANDKTLEISCKIFTDDFEKTLRQVYQTHIDLLKPAEMQSMNRFVNDYVQKHLTLVVNGETAAMHFKGYEQVEEAIYSYYQVDDVPALKSIRITDKILYDYKPEQISLIHLTVNGNRQSTKLVNPEDKVNFDF